MAGVFGVRTFATTGATTSSSPSSWINNQPINSSGFSGSSGSFTNANTSANGFGRLVPFNPNAVYPPISGGKWPNKVEPPPEGFGQTPESGGGQEGDSKPSEEKAEPAQPDTEETERQQGQYKKKKELKEPRKAIERIKKGNKHQPMKHLGVKSMDSEGGSSGCGDMADPGSLPDDLVPSLGAVAKNISTQMPAMEQLLQNIPNEILGNFMNNLPTGLKSFIPPNLLTGVPNVTAFNLNGLMNMVGGNAISYVANNALRSILPSIGIPQQALQQLSSITSGVMNNQTMNAGSVSQFLSVLQTSIGSSRNSGIPLDQNSLSQAVSLALNSTGLNNFIPANITGVANTFARNPMGSIVNAAMGGNAIPSIPILPSNLSNPAGMLLSGLNQFIPADVAQGLFNVSQLTNMLPGNLQNLIPQIAPVIQGAAPNLIEQVFNAAPEKVPGSDQSGGNQDSGGGGGGCKIKQPPNDGKNAKGFRDINYAQPLSPNFDLWQLVGTAVEGGSHRINKGKGGSEVDEVIKNLSSVAINVLEPLKEAYPMISIISGYRESGEHAKGKVVDVAFPANPTKLMEIADWARKNLPVTVQMNQFKTGWLHLKFEESCKGGAASSASASGCESGLVNRKG